MRADIASALKAEPTTVAIDWYLERGVAARAEGRPVLAAAYGREAVSLSERRPESLPACRRGPRQRGGQGHAEPGGQAVTGALLARLLGAADRCAPVAPAAMPVPEAASLYRKAGDDERAAGAFETATVAYRAAAALDPGDAASRGALGELCTRGGKRADPFEDGLVQLESRQWKAAAASFEQARKASG